MTPFFALIRRSGAMLCPRLRAVLIELASRPADGTDMKKVLGVSILAALLVACADSGQGSASESEVGRSATAVNATEPGVAPEPGTIPTVSTGAVTEAPARPSPIPADSAAKPAATPATPDVQQTTPPEPQQPQAATEQGEQTSPEPRTGDDANPDSINPRR